MISIFVKIMYSIHLKSNIFLVHRSLTVYKTERVLLMRKTVQIADAILQSGTNSKKASPSSNRSVNLGTNRNVYKIPVKKRFFL